ncbi:hypothetical protein [Micromonospora sp. NBC_01412]|uniref:hypothetical protein n=1 Tax=Micromonospora sp. NBC_01412 TaxID=2903590 RepID=UPI0032522D46
MTVIAREVVELARALRAGASVDRITTQLPRRFAKIVRMPWTTAAVQDTRLPTTDGVRIPGARAMDWYTDTLWELATRDPAIASTLWSSYQMITSSRTLFAPRIAARVTARRLAGPPVPPERVDTPQR